MVPAEMSPRFMQLVLFIRCKTPSLMSPIASPMVKVKSAGFTVTVTAVTRNLNGQKKKIRKKSHNLLKIDFFNVNTWNYDFSIRF